MAIDNVVGSVGATVAGARTTSRTTNDRTCSSRAQWNDDPGAGYFAVDAS